MRKAAILAAVVVALAAFARAGEVTIDTSTTLDGSNTSTDDFLSIIDGPLGPPAVVLATGADIFNVAAYGGSTLAFHGGTTDGDALAYDHATIDIFAGQVGDDLRAFGDSTVNVHGGIVGPGGIFANDRAVLNIHGGQLLSQLAVDDNAIINVFGSNLTLTAGSLLGFLQDGTPVSQQATAAGAGQIVLHNVPEPSSLALLAIGVAAVGWRSGRRGLKRRGERQFDSPRLID